VRTHALIETFGISRAQASKDFAVYMALRPLNLRYNKSKKYYEAGADFSPLLLTGKTSELLEVLSALPHGDGPVLALATQTPAVALLRPMERELDIQVFRAISMAAYNKVKLRLAYQSMNRPEPSELVLSPHTLVFSGFRWHVRAFSDTHGEFRDFVLARVRGMPLVLNETGMAADGDTLWHTEMAVQVLPHPALPPAQQAVIAEDYGMVDGQITQQVLAALVPYFLRLMQIEPAREHPDPKVQQIVLGNREALAHLLW
jgi:predicted DNA-binding transcriptional regulator YafY